MITFKDISLVYDEKSVVVGAIHRTPAGYYYAPRGERSGPKTKNYPTLDECKKAVKNETTG